MLTRLEIDGFKSFESLEVDFAPFTVILGANAAGKSNLFDAIRLLSLLATRDVSEAAKEVRGEPLELFRLTNTGRAKEISIAAEVLVDPMVRDPWGSAVELTHTRMRYEVTLQRREVRQGIERIHVAKEAVTPILSSKDGWARAIQPSKQFRVSHLKYARQKPWLTTEQLSEGLAFSIHQDGRQGRVRPASAAEATVLSSITNAEFAHLFALREEMRYWRLLQLDPALLRRPTPATASDVLAADGANLAAVLAQLRAETASPDRQLGALSEIAVELNSLVPGISKLDARLDEASREYRIELTMKDWLPFSSRVISDGTLRVLALLTLLYDPRHRGLVCFEEPENGVHPGRIRELVLRLQDLVTSPSTFEASQGSHPLSQLLINSHSPVVLAALMSRDLSASRGEVLFADTTTIADPGALGSRRRSRLRPVRSGFQDELFRETGVTTRVVSPTEVRQILATVAMDA